MQTAALALSQLGQWIALNVFGLDFSQCAQGNDPFVKSNNFATALQGMLDPATFLNCGSDAVQGVLAGILNQISPTSQAGALVQGGVLCVGNADKVAQLTREAICTMYNVFVQCSPCDVPLVGGLILCKWALKLLGSLRGDLIVGVNLGLVAWGKVAANIGFQIAPLEKVIDYFLQWACPSDLPSTGEIVEMFLRDEVNEEHATCLMKARGIPPNMAKRLLYLKREKLHPKEIIEYGRRNQWTEQQYLDALRTTGWVLPNEVDVPLTLYDEIPPITDFLHFLQRNAFDSQYVQDFGLLDGFTNEQDTPAVVQEMAGDNPDSTGRPIFWDTLGKYLEAKGITRKWAAYHYAAHWLLPSAGEAKTLLHRLRPGRTPPDQVFDAQRYLKTLQEQDVAPSMRQRYLATAYEVIGIRFLRNLFYTGQVDEQECLEILQDQGYTLTDAQRLLNELRIEKVRTRAQQSHGFTVAKLQSFYKDGLLSRDDTIRKVESMGFNQDEATNTVMVADMELQAETLNKNISAYRQCYLTGKLGDDEAQRHLAQLGLDDHHVQLRLSQWRTERQCGAKDYGAREILDSLKRGLMTFDVAAQQLSRINLTPDMVAYYLAVAHQELDKQAARSLAQREKQLAAMAKQLEQQLVRQQKKDKALAKIRLDLDKAKRRADLMLAKAEEKAQAKAQTAQARAELRQQVAATKAQAIMNSANVVKPQKPRLTQAQRQAMLAELAALKEQYTIDVAQLTDKLDKANRKAQYDADVAAVKESYVLPDPGPDTSGTQKATIKANLVTDTANLLNTQDGGGAAEVSIPQSVQQQAQDIIVNAEDTAKVARMPPP